MTTQQVVSRVLEERARALAQVAEDEPTSESIQLLLLELREETYGVDVREVAGIEPVPRVVPVPGAPPSWAGVVNLRGTLYAVLDGARYLRVQGERSGSRIALLAADRMTVALLVDGIAGIHSVGVDDIRPAASGAVAEETAAVRGATPDLLPVLDVQALLAEARREIPEAS